MVLKNVIADAFPLMILAKLIVQAVSTRTWRQQGLPWEMVGWGPVHADHESGGGNHGGNSDANFKDACGLYEELHDSACPKWLPWFSQGSGVRKYVIRNSNYDGVFNEVYGLDQEFHVPGCLK